MKHLLPDGWDRPKGYSNGIEADGRQVYVAGMIGWDENGVMAEGFVAQFEQVLKNIIAVLAEAGAGPEHIVRMTWYVKGMDHYRENLTDIGKTYRNIVGRNFPVMAVVGVADLVEPGALLEIEADAVIPNQLSDAS